MVEINVKLVWRVGPMERSFVEGETDGLFGLKSVDDWIWSGAFGSKMIRGGLFG